MIRTAIRPLEKANYRKTDQAARCIGPVRPLNMQAQAMSVAEGIAAIVSAIVPLIVALAGLLWWAYRRGEAAGAEKAAGKAKVEALERLLTETRAELASLNRKRRHLDLRAGG